MEEKKKKKTQGNASVHAATRHTRRHTRRTAFGIHIVCTFTHMYRQVYPHDISTLRHTHRVCGGKLFIQTSQSSSDRVNCRGIKDGAVETG